MTSRTKFAETTLPPIDAFFNKLNDEPLSESDYQLAMDTWEIFNITNLEEYDNHYLKLDVLLLADVFQNFRDIIYSQHKLDCLHFYTLPSLSWAMALKFTKVKLDLFTEPSMYLMVETSLRGGISIISHRHAVANNPHVEGGFDSSLPTSYLVYLDANNLYGAAMREPLPTGNFRWLSNTEVDALDITNIPRDSSTGYILEVDIDYPESLHETHNDYPLCPDHMTVTENQLSDFCKSFPDRPRPSRKLVPNLYNKRNYVVHYRNLQFYIQEGMILKRVHRVLAFHQSAFLSSYIDVCTQNRQMAKSQFEMDLWKLCANAIYGKSMQNQRKQMNVRLIADPVKLKKALSKPNLQRTQIINDELVMVHGGRMKLTLNRPLYLGFAILDISKLIMYQFHYQYIVKKYGQSAKLCFTDTDSLTYHIQTDDIYQDMKADAELFDLSNFKKDSPFYSGDNRKVVGKMKSETGDVAPKEFVGLRSKMYSLYINSTDKPKMAAKGIKRTFVKKNLRHEQYLRVLQGKVPTKAVFRNFRSRNHVVSTVEYHKCCLSAFDDKRYILDDGVTTLAYGHKDIPAQ